MTLRNILFYRDFEYLTGGHLKVWHYFNYVQSSNKYTPSIFFTERSSWIDNPWLSYRPQCVERWDVSKADLLFLGGLDWLALSESQRLDPPVPVVNLIQHVRHSIPSNPLYQFLPYPATRICVSQEVADAILSTGRVNGDIFVNRNGLDLDTLNVSLVSEGQDADIQILIAGLKNPRLAENLAERLSGVLNIKPVVLTSLLPRDKYLSYVKRAKVTLFLPNKSEGFYLPALEGMALGTLVVCPDCVGNRGFCLSNNNCIRPDYTEQSMVDAVVEAWFMEKGARELLLSSALKTANSASMENERLTFLAILDEIFS